MNVLWIYAIDLYAGVAFLLYLLQGLLHFWLSLAIYKDYTAQDCWLLYLHVIWLLYIHVICSVFYSCLGLRAAYFNNLATTSSATASTA